MRKEGWGGAGKPGSKQTPHLCKRVGLSEAVRQVQT